MLLLWEVFLSIGPISPWNHCVQLLVATYQMFHYPMPSMYGVFTYIWLIFMVNVSKYTSPMDGMAIVDTAGISQFP